MPIFSHMSGNLGDGRAFGFSCSWPPCRQSHSMVLGLRGLHAIDLWESLPLTGALRLGAWFLPSAFPSLSLDFGKSTGAHCGSVFRPLLRDGYIGHFSRILQIGQPILVGHHSERRHRNAIKKADNAMRRAHEHNEMAEHHRSKAAGLARQLDSTIYSDDPDAVEALEAKIEGMIAEREKNKQANKILRRKPKNEQTPEKVAELTELLGSEARAIALFEPDFCGRVGIPAYVGSNLSGNIKRCKDRLKAVKRRQSYQERAEAADGVDIHRSEEHNWCTVTFAEKPDRSILTALKAAGYRWGNGSWNGYLDKLPEEVSGLQTEEA